jgi:RNA recognition motif-containing protein
MSSAKLYVGNLSYDTSEASLRTAFEAHGEVTSVNLIMDRDSGRPKGFAFVEMATPEDAQKAKAALDGTQLDGRALKVDEAKPQEPRAPRSGGYGGGGGGGYGGGGNRRW